ncbi:hypothetical protein E2C01_042886 [Portunus trituberculatus]|uniref:Uncharacterized protein n=1 Tax=Portunus trituberculatus TaxID=210409 RepID=A0A5B7FVV0_PORTR|nr:hypothetical protein [Portunus trituberculatus]
MMQQVFSRGMDQKSFIHLCCTQLERMVWGEGGYTPLGEYGGVGVVVVMVGAAATLLGHSMGLLPVGVVGPEAG